MSQRQDAIAIFNAAVEAVQPANLIRQRLQVLKDCLIICDQKIEWTSFDKLIVIAVGKAAAAMARETEQQLAGFITAGICITKYEHRLPLEKLELIEAGHPIPDENSIMAGEKLLQLMRGLSNRDLVLVLISGGASSLLADLPDNCSLVDLQVTVDLLLKSGASIHEMNAVRKHLSQLKGGQLAKRAQPARVFSLVLSDVVGDDLDTIASGLTVPDSSTFEEVWRVLRKYGLADLIPVNIKIHIEKGLNRLLPETPKSSEICFSNTFTQIIGSNAMALKAAREKALSLGYHTLVYKENAAGNTDKLARELMQYVLHYNDVFPVCLLLGGETTLKIAGTGKGGRNQHFVLCALDEWSAMPDPKFQKPITILSAGTDGTDGPTNAAGAIGDAGMIKNAASAIKTHLEKFDAYHFFEQRGGLIVTGPTQTNVMDIMMVLIGVSA
jgi:glycerate 2-kinase